MNDEILKIIYDANNERRIISQDDIYNILQYLIYYNSLQKYCTEIDTDSYCEDPMTYCSEYHEIEVNYKNLLKEEYKIANYYKKIFLMNNEEVIKFINNIILLCSLHEINHVYHEKIKEERLCNLALRILLKKDKQVFKIDNGRFYDENYNYFYSEYHAEINALYTLITEFLNKDDLITHIFNVSTAQYLFNKYKIENNIIITPIDLFNENCLKNNKFSKELLNKLNQSKGTVEDILEGRIITKESLEYIDKVDAYKIQTLNLFNDLY